MGIFDAHLHLNGSVSQALLERKAREHNVVDAYEAFVSNAALISTLYKNKGSSSELVGMIFQQFSYVYRILTIADIPECVADVMQHTTATDLEIRTTPKVNPDGSLNEGSISLFVEGLSQEYEGKRAVGILTCNRNSFSRELGMVVVDRVVQEMKATGKLVGIDIAGDPYGERTLTGDDLIEVILYALNNNIGVTIHIGEASTEIEMQEVDNILTALEQFADLANSKLRLGHCIYLTAEQKQRIRQLRLPIEVAPSCHKMLGWMQDGRPHPVVDIHKDKKLYLFGTDDALLFGGDAQQETKTGIELLGIDGDLDTVYSERRQFMFA